MAGAVPGELKRRPQHVRHALNESEAFPFEILLGTRFAVELDQLGFVIEEVELTGRARHVQVDDILGPRRVMRLFLGQRVAGEFRLAAALAGQHCRQSDRSQSRALAEKVAARDGFQNFKSQIHD
jgi:hypothetical protein